MVLAETLPLFEEISFPTKEEEYFLASHLRTLFFLRIARSQATGKDGVRIHRFSERLMEETAIIERKVLNQTYRFTTFKERLLLRGAQREPRQISIPTVRDRLTLRAVCEALHAKEPASSGSSPHAVVDRVVEVIRNGEPQRSFVRVDVKNFFPSVTHLGLERALKRARIAPSVRHLCLNAVRTPTGAATEPNARGIPQGLSISNALAAIYMVRFDARQSARFNHFFRYVDDILCISSTVDAEEDLKRIEKSLNSMGLSAHPKGVAGKTEISPVEDGIDFLGYHISIQKVCVRDSSYRRMFKNLLKVITDFRYRKRVDRTLFRLNLKITGCIIGGKRRGWMMFFSRTEDKSQLAFLDRFVKDQLRRVEFPIEDRTRVKTIIKTYHEIRYNLAETKYIPNFDKFDTSDKIATISTLRDIDVAVLETWDIQRIEDEFNRLVSKEVHELEEDVGSPS